MIEIDSISDEITSISIEITSISTAIKAFYLRLPRFKIIRLKLGWITLAALYLPSYYKQRAQIFLSGLTVLYCAGRREKRGEKTTSELRNGDLL